MIAPPDAAAMITRFRFLKFMPMGARQAAPLRVLLYPRSKYLPLAGARHIIANCVAPPSWRQSQALYGQVGRWAGGEVQAEEYPGLLLPPKASETLALRTD